MQFEYNTSLLKLMMVRQNFDLYASFVKPDVLNDIQKSLMTSFRTYYDENQSITEIDTSSFLDWFFYCYNPNLSDTERQLYIQAFLSSTETAEKQDFKEIIGYFQKLRLTETVQRLTESNDKVDVEKIEDAFVEFRDQQKQLYGSDYVENDINKFCDATNRDNGLSWRLNCLNRSIGPLILGDFILVFAFVDTGKTRWLASELTKFASQLTGDQKVLYFNNEEPDTRCYKYLYCAALNKPWDVITAHPEKAQAAYTNVMQGDKDRIMLFNADAYSIRDIERQVKLHKPSLIAIDLVNNLSKGGGKSERHDLAVTSVAWKLRHIAKTYCPVIAVMQADNTAMYWDKESNQKRPVQWLSFAQLADSKVGLPGKADAIIGIGRQECFPAQRYIHVSKNKLNQSGNTNDIMLKQQVNFDGACCRYYD